MASKKKIDKFVYLHERDKVKGLFGNIELYNSSIKNDEVVEDDKVLKTEVIPDPVKTEAVIGSSRACSCCQVRFDSGDAMPGMFSCVLLFIFQLRNRDFTSSWTGTDITLNRVWLAR